MEEHLHICDSCHQIYEITTDCLLTLEECRHELKFCSQSCYEKLRGKSILRKLFNKPKTMH